MEHVGKIGDDGEALKQTLLRDGVDVDYLIKSDFKSGHAIIQVDPAGQNSILLYGGANHDIDRAFIDRALAVAGKTDILLVQNEITNVPYVMQEAHKKGLRIAFNPSPITEELMDYPLQYVRWFILNEIEGQALTGESLPESIAAGLTEKYPQSAVVLTLGGKGVLYSDGQTVIRHGV